MLSVHSVIQVRVREDLPLAHNSRICWFYLSPPGNALAQGFFLKLPLSLPVSGLRQQIHRKDYKLLMDMFGAVSFMLGSTGTPNQSVFQEKNKIDTEIPRPRGSRKVITERGYSHDYLSLPLWCTLLYWENSVELDYVGKGHLHWNF